VILTKADADRDENSDQTAGSSNDHSAGLVVDSPTFCVPADVKTLSRSDIDRFAVDSPVLRVTFAPGSQVTRIAEAYSCGSGPNENDQSLQVRNLSRSSLISPASCESTEDCMLGRRDKPVTSCLECGS
jgi:hypothetical protein